jgi:outer membrane protein assembly factor BamB
MQALWKLKLTGTPTPPVVASRLITYKGFKDLIYVSTSADHVYSIDHAVGKVFWETHLPYDSLLVPVKNGTANCPAGMTGGVSLATAVAPPPPPPARGPGGVATATPGRGGNPAAATPVATLPRPKKAPGTVFAVSSDGLVHQLNQHTGADIVPAARFIRGNAKALDVISVGGIVYAVTSDGCGAVPNGVWSLTLENNLVSEWKSGEASVIGLAFSSEGTLYATTTTGIVALDGKTLKVKQTRDGSYATSPMVFKFKDKEYVAAGNVSGHVFLLDPESLELLVNVPGGGVKMGGALATWEDAESKTRWVLAPKDGKVTAFKVVEAGGKIALEQAWASREMASLAPPIVVNGVVFALASGSAASGAVLYAMDGMTGKELWNSGKAIAGYSTGAISAGASQVYVGTHDGTLYAFGYALPRE